MQDRGNRLTALVEERPDIVVLNRFGWQELKGAGLLEVLDLALACEVPVAIAVPEPLFARWLGVEPRPGGPGAVRPGRAGPLVARPVARRGGAGLGPADPVRLRNPARRSGGAAPGIDWNPATRRRSRRHAGGVGSDRPLHRRPSGHDGRGAFDDLARDPARAGAFKLDGGITISTTSRWTGCGASRSTVSAISPPIATARRPGAEVPLRSLTVGAESHGVRVVRRQHRTGWR
ncbi:DUF2478 domain-containing protein [Azospirillum sp. Vi22]|nr:DUF2478 domain-containing protein [Azospirillum baldaniorum]